MNRLRIKLLLVALSWQCLFVAGLAQGYPNAELLVEPSWLATQLEDPALLVIDMRSPASYEESHVPGAVNLPVDAIVETISGVSFEFDGQRVASALGGIGLISDR